MGLFSLTTCVMLLPLTSGCIAATYFAFPDRDAVARADWEESDSLHSAELVAATDISSGPPESPDLVLWVHPLDWDQAAWPQ